MKEIRRLSSIFKGEIVYSRSEPDRRSKKLLNINISKLKDLG
ncbi:hypothetical protein A45J_2342 [hot springs metagenome]|uniref:Uncharacterized protein n=1 Tax=hot springs metagenome TaxID=433727 RepID=A0A5J4KY97_9ZZZZ